jgi:hypothetical protein
MKRTNILFCLLITSVGCSYFGQGDKPKRKDLTGRFVYQENNRDTIDVNSDGTYSNYTSLNGRKLQNSGTWIYDSLGGRVVFQDFSFLTDSIDIGDSTFVPRGNWDTRTEIENNEIRLIYASDTYKGYFLKIDSVDRKKID